MGVDGQLRPRPGRPSPPSLRSLQPARAAPAPLLPLSQMPCPARPGRHGRAYRLRDAAPDRMSAADWPGQNSSPEAEIGRQAAAASSRQTTRSAAMAPAATHFRLPRPTPEARLSAPRSASPVATATRAGPRCARASRRPESGCVGVARVGRVLSAAPPTPRSLRRTFRCGCCGGLAPGVEMDAGPEGALGSP